MALLPGNLLGWLLIPVCPFNPPSRSSLLASSKGTTDSGFCAENRPLGARQRNRARRNSPSRPNATRPGSAGWATTHEEEDDSGEEECDEVCKEIIEQKGEKSNEEKSARITDVSNNTWLFFFWMEFHPFTQTGVKWSNLSSLQTPSLGLE
ncbi:hypothetical protein AAY473_015894 [Plecturocebus cupreus]